MPDDYILRSDAIALIAQLPAWHGSEGAWICQKDVLDTLKVIPADVAPVKHGYFIGTEFDGYADEKPVYYKWICSECMCVFEDDEPHYKYCPNCGAKMDKEKDYD